MTDQDTKKKWGGKRTGSGRKSTAPVQLAPIDIAAALAAPPPDEIERIAAPQSVANVERLAKVLIHGRSESARISAANELLDRSYGKPAVEIGGDAAALSLPFACAPAPATMSVETRNEARKYAVLAIETLVLFAEAGASEGARVSAAKSLLARGLGTVGVARLPSELLARPLGKKEEAAATAKAAATGRYATPAPPREVKH